MTAQLGGSRLTPDSGLASGTQGINQATDPSGGAHVWWGQGEDGEAVMPGYECAGSCLVFHQTLVERGEKEGLLLQTVQGFLFASPQMIPFHIRDSGNSWFRAKDT